MDNQNQTDVSGEQMSAEEYEQNRQEHDKAITAAKELLDSADVGTLVATLVDNGHTMSMVSNVGAGGMMHLIDVLTMKIGEFLLEEHEGRTDVPSHEAYAYGAMAVAKHAMDHVNQMKGNVETNENGGKHVVDELTDTAKGSDVH